MEGREILMLCHQLAVALRERTSRPCEADMAGPGVARSACRRAARRPPLRDAAETIPGNLPFVPTVLPLQRHLQLGSVLVDHVLGHIQSKPFHLGLITRLVVYP